jgi:hypothetical protein
MNENMDGGSCGLFEGTILTPQKIIKVIKNVNQDNQ